MRLFPHSFKGIGWIICAITAVAFVIAMFYKDVMPANSKEYFVHAWILGMSFIALSKDKIEDELSSELRMRSLAIAFVFGAVTAIVQPYLNWMFDGVFEMTRSYSEGVLSMYIVYIFSHLLSKSYHS